MNKENIPGVPLAKHIPHVYTVHGEEIVDDFYWMRDRNDPEVMEYLKAENSYTERMMKPTRSIQEKIFNEIKNRIKEDDISAKELSGRYLYYKRMVKGKQYPIYIRKVNSADSKEEILLDANELAEGRDYFMLGVFKVSPDHKLLIYSVDTNGSEEYTLYIKDLETWQLLRDQIEKTSYTVIWANDCKNFFYTVLNEQTKRPFKLFRHVIGTSAEEDQLVYHEPDEAFFLYLFKTRDKKYFLMPLKGNNTTEFRYLATDNPSGEFKIIHPRQKGMEYSVDHRGNKFYIHTNDNNDTNFKLMEAPEESPAKENWKELIPHRKKVLLEGFAVMQDYLILFEREDGLRKIRAVSFLDDRDFHINFPESVYTCSPYKYLIPPVFDTTILRFNYTSLITPNTVYDYDLITNEMILVKQDEVLGGYNKDNYFTERVASKAHDGEDIYISLVYSKNTKKDGKNPLLLYGYGSYGSISEPSFRYSIISLLDRGVIFGIAHVRGSSLKGREWYEKGKLLFKKNTFKDFISCSKYLIAENYTSKDNLGILGGSAGGLLVGAVINMEPGIFKSAIADVPFVDVISTMLDDTIPLTVMEYDEWGNPNDREFFNYMKSYSPYDNVISGVDYPDILVMAGLNDPRVQYWEPAKWTAKLREKKAGDSRLLLKTNLGSGHFGETGRYNIYKEFAFKYAFFLDTVGIKE